MRSILAPAAIGGGPAVQRLILLPGAYQTAGELVRQGFAASVTRRRLPLDVEFVDAEMAHLCDRDFLGQLDETVIRPARTAGCRHLWLAGISLGGFMALLYAEDRPGSIDGLCLIAPYLGNRPLLAEIERAQGVAAWQPGALADDDEERRIWRFLRAGGGVAPPIFLGFGCDDRFVRGHRLLANALPSRCVKSIAGGHEWPVWLELWENFLDVTFHDAARA